MHILYCVAEIPLNTPGYFRFSFWLTLSTASADFLQSGSTNVTQQMSPTVYNYLHIFHIQARARHFHHATSDAAQLVRLNVKFEQHNRRHNMKASVLPLLSAANLRIQNGRREANSALGNNSFLNNEII
jgi:hypothetical protein